MNEKLENFTDAFIDTGGGDMHCDCGKHYFETDWLESLGNVIRVQIKIDDNCIEVDSVRRIEIMGNQYVQACDCYEQKLKNVMGFIDSHKNQIADYLNSEKKRLINEANAQPEVNI